MLGEREFSKLKFRVDKLADDELVTDAYPELNFYPVIKNFSHSEKDKILRAIILLYSSGSPFVENILDLSLRYMNVYEYLGLEFEKDRIPKEWEDIFYNRNDDTTQIVHCFISKINYTYYDFRMLIACEWQFEEYQKNLMEEIGDQKTAQGGNDDKKKVDALEKKQKLSQACKELVGDIKRYREIIYKDPEIEKSLAPYIPVRPEVMSKK